MTRGAELLRIAREGKRIRTRHLEVRAAPSPLAHIVPPSATYKRFRVGFVVPKYKHSAVARNLVKRRLRELARLHLLPSGITVDVVVRIRPEAYSASFDDLAAEILSTISQLRTWFDVSSRSHVSTPSGMDT